MINGEDLIVGINTGFIMLGLLIISFSMLLTYMGRSEKRKKGKKK